MKNAKRAICNFIGSGCLYTGAAAATHTVAHSLDGEWTRSTFWWVFIAVQVVVGLGYAMSSLPKYGKWVDGEADTEYKLNIIVGVLFAVVAGNVAYYLSYYELNVKHLYCFLTALAGGFAGEKWLAPILLRLLPSVAPDTQEQNPPKGG